MFCKAPMNTFFVCEFPQLPGRYDYIWFGKFIVLSLILPEVNKFQIIVCTCKLM